MTKTSKAQIWNEVHSQKVECPHCSKRLSFRTLRWKHVCERRSMPLVMLDPPNAEQRRRELEEKAVAALNARLARLRPEGQEAPSGG